MKKYIFFDLDGTLTDSAEGITNSVAYALKRNGIFVEDKTSLNVFVGPPLVESFMKYYIKTRGCFDLKVADILLWLGVEINVIGWKILKRREREIFYKTKWILVNKMC